jgi:hypothetical protein
MWMLFFIVFVAAAAGVAAEVLALLAALPQDNADFAQL